MALAIVEGMPVDADAMALQRRAQGVQVFAQAPAGLLVGVLGHFAALAVAEGVGEKQLGVLLVGLDEHDVGFGVVQGVVLEAQRQPRVDHGAEGLAHDRRKTAIDQ